LGGPKSSPPPKKKKEKEKEKGHDKSMARYLANQEGHWHDQAGAERAPSLVCGPAGSFFFFFFFYLWWAIGVCGWPGSGLFWQRHGEAGCRGLCVWSRGHHEHLVWVAYLPCCLLRGRASGAWGRRVIRESRSRRLQVCHDMHRHAAPAPPSTLKYRQLVRFQNYLL
jgi:hypothetical protein